MKNKQTTRQLGFTLLELLVVISIIGLLASTFIFGYAGWTDKARLANTKSFSQSVRSKVGFNVVGQWTFDDGTAKDVSGNNNNGTIYGASSVDGVMGKALSFNGTTNYVSVNDSASLGPQFITITAWVNPTTYQYYANVVTKRYPAQYILWFYNYDGRIQDYLYGGGAWRACTTASSVAAPLNEWSFLSFTYDGQKGKVYVNGKEGCSFNYTGTIDSSNSAMRIGSYYTGSSTSERFKGVIDDVAIYREAFTVTQVQQLYVEGLTKHVYEGRPNTNIWKK
ncbi:prepilin-type N-terminal cleavage/methylation domain-containing protein [Candidatus Parcubacteria bacterium]|nr:prepilin-type N-terminal cleavage/methylation domain-containing protein [Candidatus Parcubacteria bacterium]